MKNSINLNVKNQNHLMKKLMKILFNQNQLQEINQNPNQNKAPLP